MWTGVVAALALVAFVLWMAATLRHMTRATKGQRIPPRTGHALLLVDLQDAFWKDTVYPREDLDRVESAVKEAVHEARARTRPVIALRQEWSTAGSRLVARLSMAARR